MTIKKPLSEAEMEALNRLRANIERLREERGFPSRDSLAKAADVDRSNLYKIMRKNQKPNEGTLLSLARELGVTVQELWGKTSRPTVEQIDEVNHPGRQSVPPKIQIDNGALNALVMTGLRYNVSYQAIIDAAPLLFCLAAEASLKRRRERIGGVLKSIEAVENASSDFPHVPRSGFHQWYEAVDVESTSIRKHDVFAREVDKAEIHQHGDDRYDTGKDNPLLRYLADWATELNAGIKVTSWESWGFPKYEVCRAEMLEYVGGNVEAAEYLLEGNPPMNELIKKIGGAATPEARAEYAIHRGKEHKAEMEALWDGIIARAAEAAKDMPDEDEEGADE